MSGGRWYWISNEDATELRSVLAGVIPEIPTGLGNETFGPKARKMLDDLRIALGGDPEHNPEGLPLLTLTQHACYSEAFAARMLGDNPDLPREARAAYRWAERQFNRIGSGNVDERDLIA